MCVMMILTKIDAVEFIAGKKLLALAIIDMYIHSMLYLKNAVLCTNNLQIFD